MKHLLILTAPLALVACDQNEPEPAPSPTHTPSPPRTLTAADLDLSALGAKIIGPQGPEVETVLSAGNRQIGKMISYVACPAGVDSCIPGQMPEGTIYTYVHRVTLAEDDAAELQVSPSEGPEVIENPPTLFRMTRKMHGFNEVAGYIKAESAAAVRDENAITITNDNGQLIWRTAEGNDWKPGKTITFWWQSTLPPMGPVDAYLLEIEGNQAIARGPFPREEKPASAGGYN